MKKNIWQSVVLFALIGLGILFHFKTFNEVPQFKHCWAQADRYALALGFLNNGGDFFHPESFVFNKQFPGDFRLIWDNTVTAVDFPIHDYLVSWIMRLFNSTDPWCFRIYIFMYSVAGLFYLYRFTGLFTESLFKSLAVLGFAISTPVFLYFQNGFLPTIPSLANCMIAMYYLFTYYKFQKKKAFILAIIFVTLAVLSRLPFAILLVAIISFETLLLWKHKKSQPFKWIAFLVSVSLVLVYYLYNNHLRATFGSLFLDHIVPAPTFADLKEYFVTTVSTWKFVYYTPLHYLVFFIAAIGFCLYRMQKGGMSFLSRNLMVLNLIFLFGCMMYYFLMAFQFLCHDYYFLDTFYLPILFFFFIFILHTPNVRHKSLHHLCKFSAVLVFVPAFIFSANSLKDYRDSFSETKTTALNFYRSDTFLDSLNIPTSSKILVMAPDGPNNPFLHLKRKGYAIIFPTKEKIAEALKWPFDYVVLENSKIISDIWRAHPAIYNELTKFATNGKITVYTRRLSNKKNSLDDFINLDSKEAKFNAFLRLDSIPPGFSSIHTSVNPFTGKTAGVVAPDMDYSFSFKSINNTILNETASVIKIKSFFGSTQPLQECLICVSVDSKGKNIQFLVNDLKSSVVAGTWMQHTVLFDLPKIKEEEFELSVFIWNKGKNTLYYDHLELVFYQ